MTLIASLLTPDYVIQAADTRLTLPNGKLFDDNTVKMVAHSGNNYSVAISYTGLAKINNENTSEWILEKIDQFKFPSMTLKEMIKFLKNELNVTFPKEYRTTIVISGWEKQDDGECKTSLCFISNCLDDQLKTTSLPTNTFVKYHIALTKNIELIFKGNEPAINERYFRKRKEKIIKKASKVKDNIGLNLLIKDMTDLIRLGANHPLYGKSIGKNCISILLKTGSKIPLGQNLGTNNPIRFPHYISQDVEIKNIELRIE